MELNEIFSSHMVFAANKPIRIFGTGKGQATIGFAGVEKKIKSNGDEWFVEFPEMDYGGPYTLKFTYNTHDIIFDDIYIGEVYLFAGQSNMELPVKETNLPKDRYIGNDKLRLLSVDKVTGKKFVGIDDGWTVCKINQVTEWPALGYLCGIDIIQKKNIAVGIIDCTQGASVIESWVPEGTFENLGINIPIDKKMCDHKMEMYSLWNENAKLYTTQILQITPFQLSSVVWYQGESDTSYDEALVYDKELCALIDMWRYTFKNDNLPFLIVQLADYCLAESVHAWRMVQNAQYRVQSMRENVKTVICRDVCENDDIHPKKKDKLAKRIVDNII